MVGGDNVTEREQTVVIIQEALPVFSRINDLYNQASDVENTALREENKVKDAARRSMVPWVSSGLVFLVMFALSFVAFLVVQLIMNISTVIGVILLLFWVACLFLIPRQIYLSMRANLLKAAVIDTTPYEKQLDLISDKVEAIVNENLDLINNIGRDYRYYDAVAFFEKVIMNGQADSLKEATNLYEEYLHRLRMEINSQKLLEKAEQQVAMLAQIEINSYEAARNAGIAATFSIANYLRR